MSMNEAMEKMVDALSESVPKAESEYMGEDGLLHCSVCHRPTEYLACVPALNINRKVRCVCDCHKKMEQAYEERFRLEGIERKRSVCFSESKMWKCTFENDNRENPKMSDAMKRYADNFEYFLKEGKGLLIYGTVGTGKSYFSACIANALIDKGYDVVMTNFLKILNELSKKDVDKQKYIESFNKYPLLILDDLGAERSSEYAQEQVYNVINTRYLAGLPFIITTNLTSDEIKKPQEVKYSRIYDRILERCHPIKMEGVSRRREKLKDDFADTQRLLGL